MKKLVAYFSATGTTKKVAEKIAKVYGADLFEIEPVEPYTDEDLDWTNKSSRSSVEMQDMDSRPQVKNKITNFEEYDVVFLGFPIWWYIAPTIINTFLESYDWKEKCILPFATSGGSGMGKTVSILKNSCPHGEIMEGRRFFASTSEKELAKWIEEIKEKREGKK